MRKNYLYIWGLVIMLLAGGNVGQAQDSLGMNRVSALEYWEVLRGVQMVGDFAYVVSGNVLHIINLVDPAHPVEVGQGRWWDSYNGGRVCLAGNLAFVTAGYAIIVFDVSDPAHPMTLAEWRPWEEHEIEDFVVLGDIAIMRAWEDGLYIVDISNPGNMQIVGGNLPSINWAVSMVGEYLCMGGVGLSMWDISDPTQPVQVAAVDTQFFIGAATISGNYAYAGTYTSGLRIIDISNPLQAFEVSSCDSGVCETVTVTGNYAIVSKASGLNIWNLANPAQPIFESSFRPDVVFTTSLASSGSLVCAGDMGAHSPSLLVIDIANPQTPTQVSSFGTKGGPQRIAVSGTVGYLASGWSDLLTVDLYNPLQISELGTSNEESSYSAFDVVIRGNFAYTACGSGGLMVFDVSNPAQPEYIASVQEIVSIRRIIIVGDYAYVIDGYSGSSFWLRTFSLQQPAAPVGVDTLFITNYASGNCGIQAANGYLYYGREWGFYVYSLTNPAAPQLVGSCDLPHALGFCVTDLSLLDHYAYVAYWNGGIRIIDIGDFAHPTEVGSLGESTLAVAVSGNTLITYGPNGISVKDLTNRLNPITIGYYYYNTTNERILDMDIIGPYLLTAGSCKFRVYQCDALPNSVPPHETFPTEFALLPPYPNPFNNVLTIPFTIPFRKEVIINIYNILGQRVKEFVLPSQAPGMHRVLWNPSECSSGVYLVQMAANGQEYEQKVVLLK
jgi:hypothetical protein